MDATTIKLCLSLFPWASFRQKKGGVKLHTVLDHDGYIPAFVAIFDASTHESRMARAMELPTGSIKNGVTSDHIIEVSSKSKTLRLRRIGYRDPESGKRYEFLTNHFRLAPKTIADIYKDRWQIEIFFREIKQNLRIKTFIGNTENAVFIQLYTALTVYLLLAYQKFLSRIGLSIQQLCQIIQLNLLGSASLDELLNPRRRKNENSYDFSLLALIA